MLEWLLAPIEPARMHDVGLALSWHGRTMVIAWGVLAPLAILIARFFKVLPWQDWPRQLDNQVWWQCHWMGQSIVLLLTIFGTGLIIGATEMAGAITWHGILGYATLALILLQIGLGLYRGSKGGPTALGKDGSVRGDHYDMTPWRRMFEMVHKSLGYGLLAIAVITTVMGLWLANAPRWMWLILAIWWLSLLVAALILQKQGRAIDTYEAIWGTDPSHPGNRMGPRGWAMKRHAKPSAGQEFQDKVKT